MITASVMKDLNPLYSVSLQQNTLDPSFRTIHYVCWSRFFCSTNFVPMFLFQFFPVFFRVLSVVQSAETCGQCKSVVVGKTAKRESQNGCYKKTQHEKYLLCFFFLVTLVLRFALLPFCWRSVGVTLEDLYLKRLNWFLFLILVEGLIIILIGCSCMIFLSPSLNVIRMFIPTVSFLLQLDSLVLYLQNFFFFVFGSEC